MAAEALDAHELVAALNAADAKPLTINDLPREVLVSIFMTFKDLIWVRHTMPLVCKEWNEIYFSKDASPLHETLEVDFDEEEEIAREGAAAAAAAAASAAAEEEEEQEDRTPRRPVVHASRVISWAERRAGWVRKLHFQEGYGYDEDYEDFTSADLRALVAVAASSLTGIRIDACHDKLLQKPFWESVRDSVAPAGRLRSFIVRGIESDVLESDVEPLGKLAGSLEELELGTNLKNNFDYLQTRMSEGHSFGLPRFLESFFALTELRRFALVAHLQITAIPAEISSLKKLEDLNLTCCSLSSLPKELGELSGLTRLDLTDNGDLGSTPEGEAFPAELGKLKSLRVLNLSWCGLGTVPPFVGKLRSLEVLDLRHCRLSSLPRELGRLSGLTRLDLSENETLGNEGEAFPADLGKMKSLRELNLSFCRRLSTVPAFVGELESLESLDLSWNRELQIDAPLDFLIKGCPRLRNVRMYKGGGAYSWTPQSLAHLEAFVAKLLEKNPNAVVCYG